VNSIYYDIPNCPSWPARLAIVLAAEFHHLLTTMSFQNFGKGALRVAKNYTKGYSDVQAKVREATSNDPWGPSGTQMNEIAQMTFNQSVSPFHFIRELLSSSLPIPRNDFVEIMEMLDKRLNDKGKNWRHVFKVCRH
jgi:epsin